MNIPNILTISRIIFIPILVVLYYFQNTYENYFIILNNLLVIIFILASITDYLDGYLARKLQENTKLGAFLDPVADKLMVSTALIILVNDYHNYTILLPAIVIIIREISVSALREWMGKMGKNTSVVVSYAGKLKTFIQIIAITILLYRQPIFDTTTYYLGIVLLYIAMFITIWSGIIYLKNAIKDLTIKQKTL